MPLHEASSTQISRLFIALWPPADAAKSLRARCVEAMGSENSGCLAADRLHLTLHFIGQVDSNQRAALQDGICAPFAPFELRLSRWEAWSRGLFVSRPLVAPDALIRLHAELGHRLRELACRTDTRPFRPHLTLARCSVGPGATGAARTPQWPPPIAWLVQDFRLCESLSGPPARYLALKTCPGLATASS